MASSFITTLTFAFVWGQSSYAGTITNGFLVEDFSSITSADLASTTGLWNVVDGVAQAAVVANNSTTRPLTFGDGSLGSVTSSSGYTFDTDAYPNGFDFVNLTITGGSVTVTGSNSLVIRALGSVSITPTISVAGGSGSAGVANGTTTGSSGGAAVTCSANGASGGNSNGTTASAGSTGRQSDGSADAGATGGAGNVGSNGAVGNSGITGPPSNNFDTASNFVCGGGAGGGGGTSTGGGLYAVGAGGGAGGGRIRIAAVGNVSVGAVVAAGGTGGGGISSGANCSGDGGGGNGGAVWLQTFHTLSTGSNPDITAGNSGGVCSVAVGGLAGARRGDSSAVGTRPGWAAAGFDTANAAASQSYYVYSSAYDLQTFNAQFSTAPTVTQTLNGGTITVEYATSEYGSTFTSWTTNILTLSNLGHRYLKFRVLISTAGVAGPSPTVDQLAIPFTDVAWDQADFVLGLACGRLTLAESSGLFGLFGFYWSRSRRRKRS